MHLVIYYDILYSILYYILDFDQLIIIIIMFNIYIKTTNL